MGRSTGKRVSKSVTKTRNVLLGESGYQIDAVGSAKKDDDLISFLLSIQSDPLKPSIKLPVEADLSNKILKDVDLFGINFTGSVFNGSKLENINFSNITDGEFIFTSDGDKAYPALFKNSTFDQAYLGDVSFQKTTLDEVSFSSSQLDQVDFSLADLKNISFERFDPDEPVTKITNSKFTMATLSNIEFKPGTVLENVSFSGAKFLTIPQFKKIGLTKVTFADSNLTGASFYQSILREVIFSKADLTYASFVGAGLKQGMFKNITANKEIDFSNSVIKQVNFSDSDLTKINLTNSDLIESTFETVDLTGVDLSHARFRDVVFNNCQLKGAKFAPGAPGIRFINCLGV
jgi:uncharacterized protein YjbI with pentapeptide repeats